jgi:Flp pilus assembly pilin Flp
MRERVFKKTEAGSTMAEFAVIAGVFFMIIIGIIEFGRLLYTHNALTDATRRGARYAVLHPEGAACVPNVVIYGEANINADTCAPRSGAQPLINGLTSANISVVYQGADLDNDPSTPPTSYGMNLGTATVTIGPPAAQSYQFTLSIPFFHTQLNMPAYTTTLTSESAGTAPGDL